MSAIDSARAALEGRMNARADAVRAHATKERDCTLDGECPIPGHTVLYRTAEWNLPPLHGQKITTWRGHR